MTISLPPISYPAKPRAPFTGTPPQNLFPDRFPMEWKNITGKPYITVSSKGLANGLSEYINDGADFGPDSLQADGTLTQSTGIREALQYAINNPVGYSSAVGGYWIHKVQLLSGYFTISKPIILNVPIKIMNLTLEGIDSMSPYILCKFNSSSTDEYPYAININNSDIQNINYINIQWSNFQIYAVKGYSPYGFVSFDFSSINTYNNVFISYNLNVSNLGFTTPLNLLGFSEIHMFDFETYGGNVILNGSDITLTNGYTSSAASIGVSGSVCFSDVPINPIGDLLLLDLRGAALSVGIYEQPNTFTIQTVHAHDFIGLGSFNSAIAFLNSSGTITINNLIMENFTADGLSSDTNFIFQQGGGNHIINNLIVKNIFSTNNYHWSGIPTVPSTTSGTTAGSFVSNQVESSKIYKKVIINLNGYENDSTTAQTYTYPVAFTTVAEITSNTASVPGVSTSLTEFSVAPDTTTAYTGIIVIEGY
jgi:hypothetical protein